MLSKIRHIVITTIDFCHIPFRRIIPTQTFRYIACGGFNTVLGLVIYSLVFVRVLHQHDIPIGAPFNISITARVAALFIGLCINTPIGFVLSSYIVFPESQIHGRVQLFRYIMATLIFLLMAYVLTKVFAIAIPIVRADVANIFVSMITAVLSYLSQRFFTFKIEAQPEEETVPVAAGEEEDVVKWKKGY